MGPSTRYDSTLNRARKTEVAYPVNQTVKIQILNRKKFLSVISQLISMQIGIKMKTVLQLENIMEKNGFENRNQLFGPSQGITNHYPFSVPSPG